MIFSVNIVVPKNTTKEDPLVTELDADIGVVLQGWRRWRYGSGNLCGLAIFYGGMQVWPATLNQWWISSPETVSWDEYFVIETAPTFFTIKTYNLDDTYEHTVWVGFNIQRVSISQNLLRFLQYVIKGG